MTANRIVRQTGRGHDRPQASFCPLTAPRRPDAGPGNVGRAIQFRKSDRAPGVPA